MNQSVSIGTSSSTREVAVTVADDAVCTNMTACEPGAVVAFTRSRRRCFGSGAGRPSLSVGVKGLGFGLGLGRDHLLSADMAPAAGAVSWSVERGAAPVLLLLLLQGLQQREQQEKYLVMCVDAIQFGWRRWPQCVCVCT